MHNTIEFNPEPIGADHIAEVLAGPVSFQLSAKSREKVKTCRAYLEKRLNNQNESIYGINTGFGALYNKPIAAGDLETLQENLLVSHACGLGEEVPQELVKLMLFLKIKGLSLGYSGIKEDTLDLLTAFLNRGIFPQVFNQGSLGASGDLAPLAHLCLPLIGKGKVYFQHQLMPAAEALEKAGLKPIKLGAKEGLALLNGTQFMSAYGCYILHRFSQLLDWADFIGAVSLEAFDGRPEPFIHSLHEIRNHNGQIEVAENMRNYLKGSKLITQPKKHVQDAYSFRCIPQVHGASRDAFWTVQRVFLNEINAVTDNPTIFPEEELIVSGGNFHGQPLAIHLDFLAIALAEIGSISERRIYKLISGERGLPEFLVGEPGLSSGFMIAQYAAASVVSQNKQLCTPASVDTIDSSKGQEDHVSMGANAATKALRVLENLEKVLGVELLTAMQALDFRGKDVSSPAIENLRTAFRAEIPFIEKDGPVLHDCMQAAINFLKTRNHLLNESND